MYGKGKVLMLTALAAAMGGGFMPESEYIVPERSKRKRRSEPQFRDLERPCPNGCKNYWFNHAGEFDNDKMRGDECVFHCYASNDRNAIRKYNNWKAANTK